MVNPEPIADTVVQPMNSQQIELYQRIQAFSLDDPDAELSFSQRLAKDNNWSLEYTDRAIGEYKKFAFLAVAAGHPVTPSDLVDQVWHLHLSYTRSYWEDFCPRVLQMSLHHDPTRGGQAETEKFDDWYQRTLESYDRFFGQSPPAEIWATQSNQVVPKSQIQPGAIVSTKAGLGVMLGICYLGISKGGTQLLGQLSLIALCIGIVFGLT